MAIILKLESGHLKYTRKQGRKKAHVKFAMISNTNNRISNLLSWSPQSRVKKTNKIWPETTVKKFNQYKIMRPFAFVNSACYMTSIFSQGLGSFSM